MAFTGSVNAPLPTTTKGDLVVHNGTKNVRLPVGTDGQILTADSSSPTGLSYTDPTAIENKIPQYYSDPPNPLAEEMWVRYYPTGPIVSTLSHSLLHYGLTTSVPMLVAPSILQHTVLQYGLIPSENPPLISAEYAGKYVLRYKTKEGPIKSIKFE